MWRWFRSWRFIDEFARDLAEEIDAVFPRGNLGEHKPKTASKQRQRVGQGMDLLERRLQDFAARERLTFLQKARLSKRLQDELLTRGHPPDRVQAIAVQVLTSI
jgi:hypothetical protein